MKELHIRIAVLYTTQETFIKKVNNVLGMKDFNDTIGNTEELFRTSVAEFTADYEDGISRLIWDSNDPQETIVFQQFGTLFLQIKYMPSEMGISNHGIESATLDLITALKKHLKPCYLIRHESQVGFLITMVKNRMQVKSIISLDYREEDEQLRRESVEESKALGDI